MYSTTILPKITQQIAMSNAKAETINQADSNTKYRLSFSNKILLTLLMLWYLAAMVFVLSMSSEIEADTQSRALGRVTGKMIAYALFPYAIGWIFWRFKRNKKRTWGLPYTITFLLMIISNLNASQKEEELNRVVYDTMRDAQSEYARDLDASQTSDERFEALDKYAENAGKAFEKIEQTGTRDQKKAISFFMRAKQEIDNAQSRLDSLTDKVLSEDFFNFELLEQANEDEFEWRYKLLGDTREAEQYALDIRLSLLKRLKADLKSELKNGNVYAIGFLEGAENKFREQRPLYEAVHTNELKVIDDMEFMLKFLQNHLGKWSADANNELEFDDLDAENAYLDLYVNFEENLGKLEESTILLQESIAAP